MTLLSALCLFVNILCPYHLKKVKTRIFIQKWLDYLLLMRSYLVTIITDSHQTCVEMFSRDMRTVLKTAGADDKSSWIPLYVRGLKVKKQQHSMSMVDISLPALVETDTFQCKLITFCETKNFSSKVRGDVRINHHTVVS